MLRSSPFILRPTQSPGLTQRTIKPQNPRTWKWHTAKKRFFRWKKYPRLNYSIIRAVFSLDRVGEVKWLFRRIELSLFRYLEFGLTVWNVDVHFDNQSDLKMFYKFLIDLLRYCSRISSRSCRPCSSSCSPSSSWSHSSTSCQETWGTKSYHILLFT